MPLPATYPRNLLLLTTALLVTSSSAEERPQATTAEQRILAALDQITVVNFIEEPLSGVVEHFADLHGIQIQIDTRNLEDVNMGFDTPVTKSLRNVTLRSALNYILRDLDFVWVIRDEVLVITIPEEAELHVMTRVYDVGRLVTTQNPDGSTKRDFSPLIETLTQVIEPDPWFKPYVTDTIVPFELGETAVLIVTQTRARHARLTNFLDDLFKIVDKYSDEPLPSLNENARQPLLAATEDVNPKTAEAEILAALDEMTIVEFIEEPLDGVAFFLREYHSIEIQIDVQALKNVNMETDTPISKSLENVTLRSALNLMLSDLDLAWIIKDEVLLITTSEVAELHVIPRVYDVERLVTHRDADDNTRQDFGPLIKAIVKSIEPGSWKQTGGPGTIAPAGKSRLAVRHTRAVHDRLGRLLEDLAEIANGYADDTHAKPRENHR